MSETTDAAPNPGSDKAIEMGCTCPVVDNAHGRGAWGMEGVFYYVAGCPVHWPAGERHGPFVAVRKEQREWRV